MAFIFMDGFGGGDYAQKWDINNSQHTPGSAGARIPGGYYLSLYQINALSKSFPAVSKLILGFGLYPTDDTAITLSGDNGGTNHISLVRNNVSGFLEIRRGTRGGTLLGTGTTPIPSSAWGYIEVSVTISDTVGEVHVRLNGGLTDEVAFTGDTKNGGTNTTIDNVFFDSSSGTGGAAGTRIADVYMLSGTGPAPMNNFLGDVTIRTLAPNGNGAFSQLTGSDGNSTDNYQLVDEHVYSTADYVGSATVGQKDTYQMEDLPTGVGTIFALQVTGRMAKTDVTLGQARYVLRSAGTDYTGVNRALSTSHITYTDVFLTDPATGAAWTLSGVNAAEAGMEVV